MVTDFGAAILNPSALVRMGHMTIASFETSVFVVAGISSYFLLKGRHVPLFRAFFGDCLGHGCPVRAPSNLHGRCERPARVS